MSFRLKSLEDYVESVRVSSPGLFSKILMGLDESNIRKLVEYMKTGSVAVFYCGTSYAMGVSAFNPEGIRRIYDIKGREASKPLSILASRESYEKWVEIDTAVKVYVEKVIQKYWPGPVSIILPKKMRNNKYIIPPEVTSGQQTVHLVCIDKITELISLYSECPIAVTSANISGAELITNPIDAIKNFGDKVDYFLVGEESQYKYSTTIIDFSRATPKIIRKTLDSIVKDLQDIIPGLEV